MRKLFISISTDFGPGNKGIGVMKAVILGICPDAQIITLANDIPGFDIREGARLLEAAAWLPVGYHICVVDPGVGTVRRGLAIQTGRGDVLVGPDNGVLLPAARFLGGVKNVHQITNEQLMREPVSPVFHGRDVFAPVAAHLACGRALREVGPALPLEELVGAPYEEAEMRRDAIEATIISRNTFGNVFLNVRAEAMHELCTVGESITVHAGEQQLAVPYRRTFGDVAVGKEVILDDDFGRVELAINQGNFAETYNIERGESLLLKRA